jgi:hypothetical protein
LFSLKAQGVHARVADRDVDDRLACYGLIHRCPRDLQVLFCYNLGSVVVQCKRSRMALMLSYVTYGHHQS